MKIGIIGCGNMGSAVYGRLLNIFSEDNIYVCDTESAKVKSLNILHFIDKAEALLAQVDTVIIAVKPQSFANLAASVGDAWQDKLVISIMAGVGLDNLAQATSANRIVRTMPNLAIKYGQGVVAWYGSGGITDKDRELLDQIFSSMGYEVEVKKETDIDSITALSGSGPAYFFYLAELLAQAANQYGFSDQEAREIAHQTLIGAAELLKKEDRSAAKWRQAVTSKGGTTEAALQYLQDNDFAQIFQAALDQARQRAQELNK